MTLGVHGAAMQAAARMPLRKIADSGIIFGPGTDATIVSHYSVSAGLKQQQLCRF